jgi:class 3 adenylate cyclase
MSESEAEVSGQGKLKSLPLRVRRTLFTKYLLALFLAVVIPLVISGLGDAWFGYRDQRTMIDRLLRVEANSAAGRITGFLDNITGQLELAVQQPWTTGDEQHRLDALRVLRQAPAIVSITLLDADARERVHVSRLELNRKDGAVDRSGDPAVIGARTARRWFGSVTYANGSEPYMTVAVAGNRAAVGTAVADVNLKFIWDVISAIHVGQSGFAFVLDQPGHLIAHPDISKVLHGTDKDTASVYGAQREGILAASEGVAAIKDTEGRTVIAATAPIPGVDWTVIVEQPLFEAFAPIYASLRRTIVLILAGAALAGALAYWLARRMTRPIHLLEEGTEQIGAGQFAHRIAINTGDELERLAARFNEMAKELALSKDRSERIARLKRFLAPQVAEIVEKAGNDIALGGQRVEVVVVFCDLRGFTALSQHAQPEEVMEVLRDYYEALGSVITTHEATVTGFSGDGLMALLNAPVRCSEPAKRGVEMALSMQTAVQQLITNWRSRGHDIGFGVGIAMGWATVGQIGYESRLEYTAIGSVVNLSARLCASAADRQILLDPVSAKVVREHFPLISLGERRVRGYADPILVHDAGSRT